MDIANLHAFVVVADTASFSLAAEQLHLTQPAVSKRIATLELQWDVRLFNRLGRKVLLTEAGHTLLPRARRILAELEDCRRALGNLSGQVAGTLSIATSHHIGLHRLPPVLRTFAARHPQVQLDMHFTDSELACEAIARGEIELGIVTLPPEARPPLKSVPIWEDHLVVVVNPGHPLSQKHTVSPQELSVYPVILPGEITFTRHIVDRFFRQQGIQLQMAFATNYLETIKMMVSVGLGWSLLPLSMVDEQLLALKVKGLDLKRPLGVVQHQERLLSSAALALLAILQDQETIQRSEHL